MKLIRFDNAEELLAASNLLTLSEIIYAIFPGVTLVLTTADWEDRAKDILEAQGIIARDVREEDISRVKFAKEEEL